MTRATIGERGLVAAFFGVVAAFALLVHDDYGVTWDEPGLVHYGNLLLEHFGPGGEWETYSNLRFYGPVGPVLLALADAVLPGPAFPAAHLANFAFFMTGAFAFYALCRYQFESRLWGLFGAAALVLSPRAFAHGMVNPKDMPLMCMFVVTVYLLVRFLDSRNLWWMVGCGAATGVAFGVRVTGAFLVALVVVGIGADLLRRRRRELLRSSAVAFGVYLAFATAVSYAIWPFLWVDPVGRLREALEVMTNFLEGPRVLLYRGDVVGVDDLPWHYLPVWIGITTPAFYLFLAAPGLVASVRGLFTRGRERFFAVHLTWLLVPLAGVALRRPPLYETGRQGMFVYPALLLLTVAGARATFRFLRRRRRSRELLRAAAVVAACAALWIVGTMIRLHPYQAMYFNLLAGDAPHEEYETDYWGVSYAEAQERLLRSEEGSLDVFTCSGPPGDALKELVPERDAERIDYVWTVEEAKYSFCTPRPPSLRPQGHLMFTIERDGILLLEAMRLR